MKKLTYENLPNLILSLIMHWSQMIFLSISVYFSIMETVALVELMFTIFKGKPDHTAWDILRHGAVLFVGSLCNFLLVKYVTLAMSEDSHGGTKITFKEKANMWILGGVSFIALSTYVFMYFKLLGVYETVYLKGKITPILLEEITYKKWQVGILIVVNIAIEMVIGIGVMMTVESHNKAVRVTASNASNSNNPNPPKPASTVPALLIDYNGKIKLNGGQNALTKAFSINTSNPALWAKSKLSNSDLATLAQDPMKELSMVYTSDKDSMETLKNELIAYGIDFSYSPN